MQSDPIWKDINDKLPYSDSESDKEIIQKQWAAIDVNSNGYLSLAEIDKGLRDVIKIPALFNLKPVIMRAFQVAKTALKAKGPHGDDYVSKAEYKYLLKYLRQYYEYWNAFDQIDKNDDRRIGKDEFAKAVPIMNKWGLNITDSMKSFKQADRDGQGMILFDEFCQWAIKKHLDLEHN